MAGEWKKLKERLEAGDMQPRESDWENMKSLIGRHPDLTRVPLYGRVAFKGFILFIGISVLVGAVLWYYDIPTDPASQITKIEKNNQIRPVQKETSTKNTEAETAGSNKNPISVDDVAFSSSDEGKASIFKPEKQLFTTTNAAKKGDKVNMINNEEANSLTALSSESTDGATSLPVKRDREVEEMLNTLESPSEISSKPTLNLKSIHFSEMNTEQDLVLLSITKEDDSEDESFIDPATGFTFSSLQGAISYAPLLNGDRSYTSGAGVEFEFVNRRFLIQTGLYLNNHTRFFTDSLPSVNIHSQDISRVDSTWIIDGPFLGHYEYDTVQTTIYDTLTTYQTAGVTPRVAYRYLEVPIMVGYRWYSRSGRWNFDLGAGVVAGWLNYNGSVNETENVEVNSLRLDLALRPAIGYNLNLNWSILARTGWRYTVLDQTGISSRHQASSLPFFQLGLSYHW